MSGGETVMNKKEVVDGIVERLQTELSTLMAAATAAHQAATHEESQAEDRYDTRGLEASYLAGAQSERAAQLERTISLIRLLPLRNAGEEDPITPGTLVELDQDGKRYHYYLAPQGGGVSVRVDDKTVQVVTPNSPLGGELVGRKVGEVLEVEIHNDVREYEVVSVL